MDGSDHARSALAALLDLPWLTSCQVAVLGVDDGRHRTGNAVEEAAKTLAGAGVAEVKQDVVKAVRHTAGFDVRSAILSTIEDTDPDLTAVGARGTGGIRGLLVGSVATAVVHHAPCSVLVAKISCPPNSSGHASTATGPGADDQDEHAARPAVGLDLRFHLPCGLGSTRRPAGVAPHALAFTTSKRPTSLAPHWPSPADVCAGQRPNADDGA